MEKAWGHSRSNIDGLRPHLIRAQAGRAALQDVFFSWQQKAELGIDLP